MKKLETSYDFYHVVSLFTSDNKRDELIVYSKDPNRSEHKMIAKKNNNGLHMIVYDRFGTISLEKHCATINDISEKFREMWQPPPPKPRKVTKEKTKKKKPLIFR